MPKKVKRNPNIRYGADVALVQRAGTPAPAPVPTPAPSPMPVPKSSALPKRRKMRKPAVRRRTRNYAKVPK